MSQNQRVAQALELPAEMPGAHQVHGDDDTQRLADGVDGHDDRRIAAHNAPDEQRADEYAGPGAGAP